MSSPRTVEIPTPNLVPTLILKQAKRQDFIQKNAELEFSYRRPQSEAASALASGTDAFLTSGRSSKGKKSGRNNQDLYATLMATNKVSRVKKKNARKSNRKKRSKNSSRVQQTETVSPKITKNLFFMSLDKRIYPDRRLKIVKKKKEHKDIHVYAPRIKKTLPSLKFDQAGVLGRRMFKELISDVEHIKNKVEVSKLAKTKRCHSKIPNNNVPNDIGNYENNPQAVVNGNGRSECGTTSPHSQNEKQTSMNNNFDHITHSSKSHQIICSLCLDEFKSMQKFKVHQKYSCKERLVKCHNPCCNKYVPLCRMDEHIKYECRWVKYTDVVINENKDSRVVWPKVKRRTI